MTDAKNRPGAAPGDIDQIRRLLFGADLERVDTRTADLDRQLREGLAALETTMRERLDRIESLVTKEVAALRGEIETQAAALGADKMDRSDLAALFEEAAGRLNRNGATREPRRG